MKGRSHIKGLPQPDRRLLGGKAGAFKGAGVCAAYGACGVSSSDKLGAVRAEMAKCDANACIFTDLADIAWLFNIRGNDVKYLPVALSYAMVEKQKAYVFMDAMAAPIAAHLKALDTEILPYDAIYEFIGRYGEGRRHVRAVITEL